MPEERDKAQGLPRPVAMKQRSEELGMLRRSQVGIGWAE